MKMIHVLSKMQMNSGLQPFTKGRLSQKNAFEFGYVESIDDLGRGRAHQASDQLNIFPRTLGEITGTTIHNFVVDGNGFDMKETWKSLGPKDVFAIVPRTSENLSTSLFQLLQFGQFAPAGPVV